MAFGTDLLSPHKLLSAEEAEKVAKKFKTPIEKFPKILKDDPQAIKLDAKPGQLIEIDRKDPPGRYAYYRYVVGK